MKINTLTNYSTNSPANKFIFTKLIKLTIIIFISLILQNCATADTFLEESVKNSLVLGLGKAIHAHGTTSSMKHFMPKPFTIISPTNIEEIQ